jgi:hypothetical protein
MVRRSFVVGRTPPPHPVLLSLASPLRPLPHMLVFSDPLVYPLVGFSDVIVSKTYDSRFL